jgi:hypothetical protein
MRRLVVRCIACITVLLFAYRADGQATRPTSEPSPWQQAVDQFSKALYQADPAALISLLSDSVAIQAFDLRTADAIRLLARTRKGEVLFSRCYTVPALTVASDLAEECKEAHIPEEIRRRLMLHDERQTRHANSVANQWLSNSLGASAGDNVAVLLLWCERPGAQESDPAIGELVFVLVKAETPASADQAPRIRQISFGDPLRSVH